MHISFLGAARTVTGSCYLLEHEGKRLLVDCGMFQGSKALKERNYGAFPFAPNSIDAILLTHAHIDHSGLLPKLCRLGFRGAIWATPGTTDLAAIMLPDSGYIQEMEVERKNRKASRAGQPLLEPIYTADDARRACGQFQAVDYGVSFQPVEGITAVFRNSGHILGAAMIELQYQEAAETKKIVFSGDLGRYDHPIVEDPAPVSQTDYLVIEATYGNRLHGDEDAAIEELGNIVRRTIKRGGNVVIPAFAVDRTQDLLVILNELMEQGEIPSGAVYVDSPLAVEATKIFCDHPECFDANMQRMAQRYGTCPLMRGNIRFSKTAEESMALNQIKSGAIILSASGMADAGRIKHHLKHNLWRPECSVIFAGYQAQGTLGRRLLEGEKLVKIHGEEIQVKAEINFLDGFSAHADYSEMLQWLKSLEQPPQTVFVTHGEETACEDWAQTLRDALNTNVVVPTMGEEMELAGIVKARKTGGLIPKATQTDQLLQEIEKTLRRLAAAGDVDTLQAIRQLLR